MPKIGIIGGSKFETEDFLSGFSPQPVKTMYGNVLVFVKDKIVFLPRHGKNRNIPAHRVNHRANICALNLLGVEKIYALNSVSSMNEKIKPGSFVIPDDYVDFNHESFFEFEIKTIEPMLNPSIRADLKNASKKAKITTKDKAIYVQTKGPRLETKAEINIIKKWGDILGWTLAREATLSQELSLPYAGICFVDRYATGISAKKISDSSNKKINSERNKKILLLLKAIAKLSR